jgi:hypothetical protein
MEGGVIPMIYELLQRIGRKKPKFFAVIDFTSGYHQAPIAKETIPYTAFITHRGVYEWVRLPMGLKGAPSYFQREVASILGGSIGVVCELYLDDLIIFATTEDEFIENLTSILERLQEHNITCNPDKCKFGIDSVFISLEISNSVNSENGIVSSALIVLGKLSITVSVYSYVKLSR